MITIHLKDDNLMHNRLGIMQVFCLINYKNTVQS